MPRGAPRNSRRAAIYAAAFLLLLPLAASGVPAFSRAASLEYPIKAAFLYKFAPFVEWPALPPDSFTICIAGHDPFGANLDRGVRDLSINGRSVRIQRLAAVQPGVSCQILYVTGTQTQSVRQALEMLRNAPVLTVTEKGETGAVIQFVIENDRVRFDIDTEMAKSHGLTVSSKLLSLARQVRPRRE